MGKPCTCYNSTTPRDACDASAEIIPEHPSSPSSRVLVAGTSPITETLAVGCAISATLGDSAIGRHSLNLTITSHQPLWHALMIVWLNHADLPLDPSVIGSIGLLSAGCNLRILEIDGWDAATRQMPVTDRPGPWLIPTLVVEQGGKQYLSYRRRLTDLTLAVPCFWFGAGASASDAGEADRWTRSVFEADRSTTGESVVSGNGLQSSDLFGELRADGTLDRDARPIFSLDLEPHPITRIGFAIGFTSCPWEVSSAQWGAEGQWSIEGTVDAICGGIESYGSYRTARGLTDPEPPGTLVVDEPLDVLPVDWVTGDLLIDDGTLAPVRAEGSAAGAVFTTRDGMTVAENVGLSEYPSGTLSTTLPFDRASWIEGTRLTLEWRWRRVRDADRRYALPGAPVPSQYRNQSNGIYLGGLLRMIVRHENAERYDEVAAGRGLAPRYGWIAQPCHPLGGGIVNELDYLTTWPADWPYDPQPPGRLRPTPPRATIIQAAGEPFFDPRGQRFMAANDGDLVALTLDCFRPTTLNPYTEAAGDTIVQWEWGFAVWINGRRINGKATNQFGELGEVFSSSSRFRAVPPVSELRVGLLALYGGAWSDLRIWRT